MLTDCSHKIQSGRLDREIHLPSTAKLELVSFIAEELPKWRDHRDRPFSNAETILTEHLCDYLNSAAYYSTVWDHIQFRTETADEISSGRKIDLTVKPRGAVLIIEGRRCSQFDMLFPIECKRLPTPKGKDRDEREYVTTKYGTTGGIQRFKLGLHGSAHTFAAMIAYVQDNSVGHWLDTVNKWIHDLSKSPRSIWGETDFLHKISTDSTTGVCTLKSQHCRESGLVACELWHLWIIMS